MNIIYTDIAELILKTEILLEIKMLEGVNMDLSNTKKHFDIIKDLTNNKPYLALIDAGNYFSIEPEALRYVSLTETINKRLAAAHYRSTIANRLTTNYFVSTYKPSIPVKLFETKAEAVEWLQAYYNSLCATNLFSK